MSKSKNKNIFEFVNGNLPNRIEISINIPPGNFIKIISENTTEEINEFFPKHLFKGKFDNNTFELFRLKRFSWFDYNITKFRGTIYGQGESTNIEVVFTMSWFYKNMVPKTVMILGFINYFLISSTDMTTKQIVIFLFIEVIAIVPYWFRNRFKLKTDKEKYIEILKSLFEEVEVYTKQSQP